MYLNQLKFFIFIAALMRIKKSKVIPPCNVLDSKFKTRINKTKPVISTIVQPSLSDSADDMSEVCKHNFIVFKLYCRVSTLTKYCLSQILIYD